MSFLLLTDSYWLVNGYGLVITMLSRRKRLHPTPLKIKIIIYKAFSNFKRKKPYF